MQSLQSLPQFGDSSRIALKSGCSCFPSIPATIQTAKTPAIRHGAVVAAPNGFGVAQRQVHSPERQDPSLGGGRRTSTATERRAAAGKSSSSKNGSGRRRAGSASRGLKFRPTSKAKGHCRNGRRGLPIVLLHSCKGAAPQVRRHLVHCISPVLRERMGVVVEIANQKALYEGLFLVFIWSRIR